MTYGKAIFIAVPYLIISVAMLVLIGWQFDNEFLKRLVPRLVAMNPMTAVSFILLALSLVLLRTSGKSDFKPAIRLLSLIVGIICAIKLVGFFTPLKVPIDQWLFHQKIFADPVKPNQMAPNTAMNFILSGVAIFNLTINRSKPLISDLLALTIALAGLLSISGYVYKAAEFYQVGNFTPMALHTAICFFLIALNILSLEKHSGLVADLESTPSGKRVTAILIPVVLIVPITLGYFRLQGERLGYYTSYYGTSLFTIANIIIFIVVLWAVTRQINRVNATLLKEIDARKKVEDKLQESNNFLNTVLENIPEQIFVKDVKDLRYVLINKAFAENLHLPKEQILGKTVYDIFTKTEADTMSRKDHLILNNAESVLVEEFRFTKDETERWFNIRKLPIKDGSGSVMYLIGIGRDITEQKSQHDRIKQFNKDLEKKVRERTEELDKTSKRFRSLIENSVDAIKMMNPDGTITFASRSHERMLGFSPEEMVQTNWFSYIHPDDKEASVRLLDQVLSDPFTPKPSTIRLRHKGDYYIWAEGTITNLLQDESVRSLVCNFHDITDRINTETERRRLEAALKDEKINRQKEIIEATIEGQEKERTAIGMELHDNINQILGTVKLYIGVAKSSPATINEMLAKSSQNLELCINETRKLSKTLVSPNISRGSFYEAITDLMHNVMDGSKIKIECHGCEEVADKIKEKKQLAFYRITQELLTNIIKHSGASKVDISFEEIKNAVVLNVHDDGKGFDLTTKRQGIGLTNIENRVEVLNGTFEIDSKLSKGSNFRVKVPMD